MKINLPIVQYYMCESELAKKMKSIDWATKQMTKNWRKTKKKRESLARNRLWIITNILFMTGSMLLILTLKEFQLKNSFIIHDRNGFIHVQLWALSIMQCKRNYNYMKFYSIQLYITIKQIIHYQKLKQSLIAKFKYFGNEFIQKIITCEWEIY